MAEILVELVLYWYRIISEICRYTFFGWNFKDLCTNGIFLLHMEVIMIMVGTMLVVCVLWFSIKFNLNFEKMAKIQHTLYWYMFGLLDMTWRDIDSELKRPGKLLYVPRDCNLTLQYCSILLSWRCQSKPLSSWNVHQVLGGGSTKIYHPTSGFWWKKFFVAEINSFIEGVHL